jgi:hypothetical protein
VAYSTLPRVERSRLHAAAGNWFESRAAGREEEVAEIVALHFLEAVSTAGPRSPASIELRRKAATWLVRAGDSAMSAAATREAEAHLRAALELVDDPDEAAAIWARLGEVLRVLPGGFEAYQHAYRLARNPARRLASLAGLLISGTRYARFDFTLEQIETAIAEGTSLVPVVGDRSLEAQFLTGVGFQSNYALQHGVILAEPALHRAEESAKRAVEISESLGDPNLVSAALDALDACAMYRNDWDAVLRVSQRRRAYGSRLSLAEMMDADHMAMWALTTLGDPYGAEQVNLESTARLRPGQVPEWRLAALCWRIRIEYTLGRWSEAMDTADQTVAAWRQLGSPVLGWIRIGFRPGLLVARGRRDGPRAQAMAIAFRSTLDKLGTQASPYDIALVNDDLDAIAHSVPTLMSRGFGPTILGDALCQLLDAGRDCKGLVDAIPESQRRVPLIEPQVRRAIGIATGDVDQMRAALELARGFSDVPTSARLAVELGRLSNDSLLLDEGRAALDQMGDDMQLERYGLT